jgi:hypothetical protein
MTCLARLRRGLSVPIALLLLVPYSAAAQSTQSTQSSCGILGGGGFIKVHGYNVVFAGSSDSAGSTLHGLAIIRAPAALFSRRVTGSPPHQGGGASVGPLWIIYDRSTNSVWIDSVAVPFDADNNLLLVVADSQGAFTVRGQARIDPRVAMPPAACSEASLFDRYHEAADTLWARFQASARVRAFLSR